MSFWWEIELRASLSTEFFQYYRRNEFNQNFRRMLKVKDTKRATVHVMFDGRVMKQYHGKDAQTRFDNEVKVLRYLEQRGCTFVPKLLEAFPDELRIITTSCGVIVNQIGDDRVKEVFAELEDFGVRHDDAEARNITYRRTDGRFCVIDFEFATILDEEGESNFL